MKVEIFADVVCPWCYIGEKRFQRAVEQFEGDVDVVYRSFQLDPDAPHRAIPLKEYLDRRFGAGAVGMMRHVSEAAAGVGIRIDWDRALSVNTLPAHRVLRLAGEEYGPAVQRELMESLFAAHFTHGRDVGDADVLTELAGAAGMDEARVREYLASGEGTEAVEQDLEGARRKGISSVPTFVIDGRYAVQGGQRTETFLQVLRDLRDGAPGHADGTGHADGSNHHA